MNKFEILQSDIVFLQQLILISIHTIMLKKYSFACALLLVSTALMAQKSVTLTEPGTLSTQLTTAERQSLTSLQIAGPLNGTDMLLLRTMAGANGTAGHLSDLDLSQASMVKGGDCYSAGKEQQNAYTQDNALSTRLFYGCGSLRRVVIPNTVRRVSNDAFSACPALEEIAVDDNPLFTSIDGMLLRHDSTLIYRCPQGRKLTTLTVSEGVKQIYPSAFRGMATLTEVNLPTTMQGVNDIAFWGCPQIRTIRIATPNPPAMENAFDAAVLASARLVVPKGAAERYRSKAGWENFKNIVEE